MGRMIIGDIIYMTGGAGLINDEDVDYYEDEENDNDYEETEERNSHTQGGL